jgi:transcriptional regulator with XRE-family HTH domain
MTLTQETGTRIPQWTFADRIRKIRDTTGMTQKEFAVKIGVKASTYATYETGRNQPRFKDVFALAARVEEVSGVPANWLVGQPSDYRVEVRLPRPAFASSGPGTRNDPRGPKNRCN